MSLKVSFNVMDRLMLLNVLPPEEDITTIKLLRKLRDTIGFDEEESKALEFQQVPSNDGKKMMTRWKQGAVGDREFDLGERTVAIIVEQLKKLNAAKKITEAHVPLYEKVVEASDVAE